MYRGNRIAVVIPVYNEERFIGGTVEQVPPFADEIYVIDDGSCDNTANVVNTLVRPRVRLIQHERNKGLGAAMSTGYKAALADKMDIVVKIDGDGQMPLELLEYLVAPIAEGKADYTKGDRLSNPEYRKGMPRFRLFGNLLLTWLTRVASGYKRLSDPQNGYTAISRKALEKINIDWIFPYYGAANDVLIQLGANNLRVRDIPMPAKYGGERSSIKYLVYIPRVSSLLLRRFVWRLWRKYIKR